MEQRTYKKTGEIKEKTTLRMTTVSVRMKSVVGPNVAAPEMRLCMNQRSVANVIKLFTDVSYDFS